MNPLGALGGLAQQFLGGLQPQQQQAFQQYAQAADSGNLDGVDHQQVLGHVQQFAQQVPQQEAQQVYQQAFAQMPLDQRQQVAQGLSQQSQQNVNPQDPASMGQAFHQVAMQGEAPLQQIFGPGGALSSPLAKAALIGIAGIIGKQFLQNQ